MPGWPTGDRYQSVLQHPRLCFADVRLQSAKIRNTKMQIPLLVSGNLACVAYVEAPHRCVVRLFFTEQAERRSRYGAISRFLKAQHSPHFADFEYVEKGIQVDGQWYPMLEMERVEGMLLRRWIEDRTTKSDGAALFDMAGRMRTLLGQLQHLGIAHGDLHDENLFVAPDGTLRLIDYDGMFVPDLAGMDSPELGRPGYQHPGRDRLDFDARLDRFSGLVLLLGLHALAERPQLWARFDNGQNLLFTQPDLEKPATSPLVKELRHLGDADTRSLLDRLLAWTATSHYPPLNPDWVADPRKEVLARFLTLDQAGDARQAAALWESARLDSYGEAASHRSKYDAARSFVRQTEALERFRTLHAQRNLREARRLWEQENLDAFPPAQRDRAILAEVRERIRLDEARAEFVRHHAAGDEFAALQIWESKGLDGDTDPATLPLRQTAQFLRQQRERRAAGERARTVGFYVQRLSEGASAQELVHLWESRSLDTLPEAEPYRATYERAKRGGGRS